ncbi:hypothetical protein JCM11251_006590 [Rhodosporidiobolus azoricus]
MASVGLSTGGRVDNPAIEVGTIVDELSHSPATTELPSETSSINKDIEKNDDIASVDEKRDAKAKVQVAELSMMEAFAVDVEGDQSPFAEVAACVPNDDPNPEIQLNHFRSWFLITIAVILFAGVNQFFSLRYPSLTIGYVVAQLLVFPVGKAWEKLPTWRMGWGKASFRLNPGKFTIKEHALITICVNLTGSAAYATGAYVSIANEEFWGRKAEFGPGFGFLFLLTTQMLGFGLAGMARKWIVYPGAMIWPSALASTVLFRALHEKQDRSPANGWTMSRYRFFALFTSGAFVWFFFPDYIFQALSTFSFLTWIWPRSQKINTIFGMNSGLGLLPITFDWTQITYAGQPLTTPFYVSANCWAAIAIFYLFLGPILYYKGVWNSWYLPILSSSTWDNTGGKYNVTRVMTDNQFDLSKYESYSPMYISLSYSLSYGLNFAAVTGVLVHTFLYSRHEIWSRFKDSRKNGDDIHRRLMKQNYKEVPFWWYVVLQLVVIGLGIAAIRAWPTELPVWGFLVVCLGFGVVFIIPEGILEGTTNARIFLNIVTEYLAGVAWPGKPLANIMVKMYGYNCVKHGLDFAMDLKLGQYMKISPRILFAAQIYSAVLSSAVQTGVLQWMFGNIQGLCTAKQPGRFTCAGTKASSVHSLSSSDANDRASLASPRLTGCLQRFCHRPKRMFSPGQTYSELVHFWWIGPVSVTIVYFLYRRWPNSWLRYVHLPIFFNSAGNLPPATTSQYSIWFIVAFLFNFLVRRRAFNWWKRYTYLLSASLDTGTALATIIIFFALTYNGIVLSWWGNNVGSNTMDAEGTPWKTVAKGTTFGPAIGEF